MKFILRTLLLAPSVPKLTTYQAHFHLAFKARDPLFDEVLRALTEFFHTYQAFPPPAALLEALQLDGHTKLANYLQQLLEDDAVPVYTDDATFFMALEQEEKNFTLQQAFLTFRRAEAALAQPQERGIQGILKPLDTMLLGLHQLKARAQHTESSTSSLLFGSEDIGSGHSLKEIYARIKDKQEDADSVYFDLGVNRLADARLKDGDLVVFGGFTSHGKSIMLRYMAYRQIVEFGRNVAFFSAEMSHDACRGLFALLHANNKVEYPQTPFIQYDAWKSGTLTDEEEDFLFTRADYDLRNNPRYGTLYIDQPNKSKFRLSDLAGKLLELEARMPVHCCVVDYLSLMYPLESERGHPERTDYNDLIKAFKNLLITHRNVQGDVAPILGITAHQLSRWGLEACLKADRHYEIAHFAEFSEIEKSADQLFTVLMTPDMRQTGKIRIQHLKNRDGVVILEPVEVYIDFKHGMQITDSEERTATEMQLLMHTMVV